MNYCAINSPLSLVKRKSMKRISNVKILRHKIHRKQNHIKYINAHASVLPTYSKIFSAQLPILMLFRPTLPGTPIEICLVLRHNSSDEIQRAQRTESRPRLRAGKFPAHVRIVLEGMIATPRNKHMAVIWKVCNA